MTVDVEGVVSVDEDERPPIPVLFEYNEVVNVVVNLVQSCWVREPDRRPSFARIAASLEEIWTVHGHGSPKFCRASRSSTNIGLAPVTSTESLPADEQYETASESMTTDIEEENVDGMIDVPLTSPGPALGNGNVTRSVFHVNVNNHAEGVKVSTQVSGIPGPEHQDNDTHILFPTNKLYVDTRNEENYRLVAGLNHAFHNSREFVSPKVYKMLNGVSSNASSVVPDTRRTRGGWIPFQAQGRVYYVVQCDRPSPELRGATPSLAVHVWIW